MQNAGAVMTNSPTPKRIRAAAGPAAACLLGTVLGLMPAFGGDEFEKGRMIEKVVCRDSPAHSYALYLPAVFDPAKSWPILFLFDPSAMAPAAIDAFRPAAEKFGWILAASNDSKNGPVDPNMKAARAMFRDVRARFSLDESRIYAGGFSGGSRTASVFALAAGVRIAGIIGIGAGISPGIAIPNLNISSYFGIAGLADFNYPEMRQLDADLDGAALPHRILFYDGRHQWAPAEIGVRALGWMEIAAIKRSARKKNEALIDEILARETAEADALSAGGKAYWAARAYRETARLFDGLHDVAPLAAEAEKIEASAAYSDFLKREKNREEKDAALRREIGGTFAFIEESPEDRTAFLDLLRDLDLGSLRRTAGKSATWEDRSMAVRLLSLYGIEASRTGYERYEKGDFLRASLYYELAAGLCPDGDSRLIVIHRNLGSMYSLLGEVKTALNHLEKAVELGFSDVRDLETDEDLAKVRKTAGFRKLIERLKKST